MTRISTKKKLIENEAYFRRVNSTVVKGLNDLKKIAKTDGSGFALPNLDGPIKFNCECSDENCRKRITATPSDYEEIHKNKKQFILIPGHHVPEVERIVKSYKDYIVVEKFITPLKSPNNLHKTDVDNA